MHAAATTPAFARLPVLRPLTTLAVWLGRRRIEARPRPHARPAARDLRDLNDHMLRDIGLL